MQIRASSFFSMLCQKRGEHSAVVRGEEHGIRTRAPSSPSLPSLRGRQIGIILLWEDRRTDSIHRQATASHYIDHIHIQSPLRCLIKANAWRIPKGLINADHFILYLSFIPIGVHRMQKHSGGDFDIKATILEQHAKTSARKIHEAFWISFGKLAVESQRRMP